MPGGRGIVIKDEDDCASLEAKLDMFTMKEALRAEFGSVSEIAADSDVSVVDQLGVLVRRNTVRDRTQTVVPPSLRDVANGYMSM